MSRDAPPTEDLLRASDAKLRAWLWLRGPRVIENALVFGTAIEIFRPTC